MYDKPDFLGKKMGPAFWVFWGFLALLSGHAYADIAVDPNIVSDCNYSSVDSVKRLDPIVDGKTQIRLQVVMSGVTANVGTCPLTRDLVFGDTKTAQAMELILVTPRTTVWERLQVGGNRDFQAFTPTVDRKAAGSNITGWGAGMKVSYPAWKYDCVPSSIRTRVSVYHGGVGSPGLSLDTENPTRNVIMVSCLQDPETVPNEDSGRFTCDIPARVP